MRIVIVNRGGQVYVFYDPTDAELYLIDLFCSVGLVDEYIFV